MRRNKKQLTPKFLTEKIMPNYHFLHQMVWTLLGLGEGILLDWWRDFAGLLEGSVPHNFNTLRGWFQYTAGMVSIHYGDGFTTLRGRFYPNSGRVFFSNSEAVFFSKVFFQPKVGFFPTQAGFFSNPRWVFFQPKLGFFPTQGWFFFQA